MSLMNCKFCWKREPQQSAAPAALVALVPLTLNLGVVRVPGLRIGNHLLIRLGRLRVGPVVILGLFANVTRVVGHFETPVLGLMNQNRLTTGWSEAMRDGGVLSSRIHIKQNCLFCRIARKCRAYRLLPPNADAKFFSIERSKRPVIRPLPDTFNRVGKTVASGPMSGVGAGFHAS